MARIKYYDASSASWKYADKAGSTTVTVDGITAIPAPETAAVGQTVVVKSIDSNGKPVEWEAADNGIGNISYYETNFVLEEDVNKITFTLPVDAVKFYMWKLSYRTPDTGVTDKRTVYLYFGGGFYNLGPTDNFGCVSLAGMLHIPNHFVVSKNTRNDSNMEHCGVGFLSGSGNVDAEEGRNDVILTTPNATIVFPAGTEVWFWGVYHK